MLLTLKPSQQHGFANPYAAPSAQQRSPSSYYSSPPKSASLPPLPDSKPQRMSTPHRGLPPPSAMERSLPLPERASQTTGLPLASLPAAPSQWQGGQDESMRTWLHAKSEEDRRKQEEEKTRQEGLKLEQRKLEQNMLQESLRGGIPPPMVPMIFASLGGGNVAQLSLEWAQHYMAQLTIQQQAQIQQQQQQQQQVQAQAQAQSQIQQQPAHSQLQASPEQRRDTRLLTGPNPNPYGAQQMQPPAHSTPTQSVQQPQANTSFTPSYTNSALPSERVRAQQPLQAAPPTSNPRPTTSQASLSRLNTGGDLHVPIQGASAAPQLTGQHPLQQTQTSQQQEQPSSPLYFHHWQPPGEQGKSKDKEQGTPSGRSAHTSPNTQAPGSHLRSEYTTSPKKRKATGSHQPAPTPSSHTSPSFNHQGSSGSTSGRRRRQNSRTSDSSSRAAHESGRQSLEGEAESSRSSAYAETRHPPSHHTAGSDNRELREIRHASRDLSERSSPKRDS
ncbi:MAG: hypothetical protein Q9175_007394 [Cornicularia normoerica]